MHTPKRSRIRSRSGVYRATATCRSASLRRPWATNFVGKAGTPRTPFVALLKRPTLRAASSANRPTCLATSSDESQNFATFGAPRWCVPLWIERAFAHTALTDADSIARSLLRYRTMLGSSATVYPNCRKQRAQLSVLERGRGRRERGSTLLLHRFQGETGFCVALLSSLLQELIL